jgi:GNAT superfamily N-acetyltransferase
MPKPDTYSTTETLRNGRRIEIRALKPTDRDDFVAAVDRTSDRSRYLRFFRPRRSFTEKEVSSFVNVDFVTHVALVAVTENCDRPTIVGAGRYIVASPGKAEVAFAVADDHQGHGIGAALLRHLAMIARDSGLSELIADILPDNVPMLTVFKKSGFPMTVRWAQGVVHVTLRLSNGTALAGLTEAGK